MNLCCEDCGYPCRKNEMGWRWSDWRGFYGDGNLLLLILVPVAQACMFVHIHSTLHLRHVHFCICYTPIKFSEK